jgi:outer membrane protein assembly factor BamB
MRTIIAIALLVAALVAPAVGSEDQAPPLFTFVHLTDAHVGAAHAADNLRAALDEIAQLSPTPDFVIDTGDAAEFGTALELGTYRDIVAKSPIPVYTAPGNHDTRWSEEGKERFRRIVGPAYRSFDHNGWHIVLMDTSIVGEQFGYLDPVQLAWLADDLARLPGGTPVVLAMHHPPSFPGAVFMRGDAALFAVIRPYNVRLILTGHGHSNRTWERDGVQLLMTKACLDGYYRIVTVGADTITTAYKMTGYGLFQDTETPTQRPTLSDPPTADSAPVPRAEGQLWKRDLGAAVQADPLLLENGAYLTTLVGDLVRLNPDDGTIAWRALIGGSIHGSAVAVTVRVDDELVQAVACASTNGKVALVRASDGTVLWTRDLGSPVVGTPEGAGDRLYVTTGGGRLVALALADGMPATESSIGPCQVGPAVGGDTVVVGCWDRRLMAFDAAAGELLWTKEIGQSRYFAPASSKPLVAEDRVIVTAPPSSKDSTPSVFALDRLSGELLWSNRLSAGYCSPAADGERVFLTTASGDLVAVSLTDGAELWRTAVGASAAHQRPCVDDGCVWVSSLGGKVSCLSASSGRALWQVALDGPDTYFLGSPVARGGRVIVGAMDGSVFGLSASGARRGLQEETGRGE